MERMVGMTPSELQPRKRPPGLVTQTICLYAEFLTLALAAIAAAGAAHIWAMPSPPLGHKSVVILLVLSVSFAVPALLSGQGVRARQLGDVARRPDQVGVRQRAYAVA